jgi:predicted transcriptional regulator of viral defense system
MSFPYKFNKAKNIFRAYGGILNTAKAIKLGIHPKTLYNMRDQGVLELLSRGLYRLSESPEIVRLDLVIVSQKIPHAVICLISALSFHEITTQIPHKVDIAIPLKAHKPIIDYPPIQLFWFSEKNFLAGIEIHKIDGVDVRIYSVEKTLADCFKYRNKIGLDIAMEALRLYWQRKKTNVSKLLEYAKVCRCEKIIKPYIEMIAHE